MRVENVSFFTGKMYTFKDDETEEEHHGMLKSFIDDVNLRFLNVLQFFYKNGILHLFERN